MKIKLLLFSMALLLVLGASNIYAQPKTGFWTSDEFDQGGWTEILYGGGEGQEGNELQAESADYDSEGVILAQTIKIRDCSAGDGFDEYLTFYKGGTITLLNSTHQPWYDDKGIEPDFSAQLETTLVVTKKFCNSYEIDFFMTSNAVFDDYPGYTAKIFAQYRGFPEQQIVENTSAISGNIDYAWIEISGPPVAPVEGLYLDIMPGSCENPVNLLSRGVLPAAILGRTDFDVTDINISTVRLNGVSPLHWDYEDVSQPTTDPDVCNSGIPDGYLDLTLKFSTQAMVATLGDVQDGDIVEVTVSGKLNDETEFSAVDYIRVLKKGRFSSLF